MKIIPCYQLQKSDDIIFNGEVRKIVSLMNKRNYIYLVLSDSSIPIKFHKSTKFEIVNLRHFSGQGFK